MNPYVSKISQLLVVSALKTLLILMVLISGVVHSGPVHHKTCDLQTVKSAAFYNTCSMKYLRVNQNKEVVANDENNYTLFTITLQNHSHGFLIFDPTQNMFLCWKKNKKNSRLVPKRNPKDIRLCIFQEESVNKVNTRYVSKINKELVMSFKFNGKQGMGKKKKCEPEVFLVSKRGNGFDCTSSYNEFCNRMKRIKHHKINSEIRHVCHIDNSHGPRKKMI